MRRIMLDTNFLLIPAQFKVDIFSEMHRICDFSYELLVLDKTLDELKGIVEKQKGRHKKAAKLALALLNAKKVKILRTAQEGSVDDILKKTASKEDIVATQDRELRRALRKKGISLIALRQKKYLTITNP